MLAKRYAIAATVFNAVQTIIITVITIEKSLLDGELAILGLSLICLLALTTSISFLGCSQLTLLLSYIVCVIYIFVRQYSVCQTENDFDYWRRSSTYYLFTFLMIFIIARVYVEKKRTNFKQKLSMDKMSQLFLSLVRSSRDGIILSSDDEVIFKNKPVNQIFDLKIQLPPEVEEEEVTKLDPSHEASNASVLEDNLIEVLKNVEPDEPQQAYNESSLNEDSDMSQRSLQRTSPRG